MIFCFIFSWPCLYGTLFYMSVSNGINTNSIPNKRLSLFESVYHETVWSFTNRRLQKTRSDQFLWGFPENTFIASCKVCLLVLYLHDMQGCPKKLTRDIYYFLPLKIPVMNMYEILKDIAGLEYLSFPYSVAWFQLLNFIRSMKIKLFFSFCFTCKASILTTPSKTIKHFSLNRYKLCFLIYFWKMQYILIFTFESL